MQQRKDKNAKGPVIALIIIGLIVLLIGGIVVFVVLSEKSKEVGRKIERRGGLQVSSQVEVGKVFKGGVDYEGDNYYVGLEEGDSIKTTNGKYIIEIREINPPQVIIDVYKKSGDEYKLVGFFTFKGEEEFSTFETLAVGASVVNGKVILVITGDDEFKGEARESSGIWDGMHLNLKKGDAVKTQTGKFVVEVWEIKDNGATLKVYKKVFKEEGLYKYLDKDGKYMFVGFAGGSNNNPISYNYGKGFFAGGIGFVVTSFPKEGVVHLDITEEPKFKGKVTKEGDGTYQSLKEGDVIKADNGYKLKIEKIEGTTEEVKVLISFYSPSDSFYGHTLAEGSKSAPGAYVTDDLTKISISASPVDSTHVTLSISSNF